MRQETPAAFFFFRRCHKLSCSSFLNNSAQLDGQRRPSREIDLVLTDVMMPRLDGFELYKKISQTRASARFLFMSGYADDVIAAHEDWIHEAPFIQKPFGLSDLDRKLKELLPV